METVHQLGSSPNIVISEEKSKATQSKPQTFNTPFLRPRPILARTPELHIALKPHARKHSTLSRGADMVTAERVRLFQDLHFRKRVLVRGTLRIDASSRDGGVDSDGRRSGRRDELGGRDGEGVDVCWVGLRDGVGLEVLF